MSLVGTMNAAKSALVLNQAALQTTGNNVANVGNESYSRQVVEADPARGRQLRPGVFVGTGVDLDSIGRKIDESLEARLRAGLSGESAANSSADWLGRVEGVFNELTDDDLSTRLSEFFNGWSELATRPQDEGQRTVVLQGGAAVADRFRDLRGQLDGLEGEASTRFAALAERADGLASQVAELNRQVGTAEGGKNPPGGGANNLRDQRDAAVREMASLIDVTARPQPNGDVNLYVGSAPLVVGEQNRGVAVRREPDGDGNLADTLVSKFDGGPLPIRSGEIAAVGAARATITRVGGELDAVAGGLIHAVNAVHSTGRGLTGRESMTSTNAVADAALALDDPVAGLGVPPRNGSFVVNVRETATGLTTSTLVQVDLDGAGPRTTLNSLAADLNGVGDVTAIVSGGRLTVAGDSPAVEVSFSTDSSGALASLGLGGFFAGTDARTVALAPDVEGRPDRVAASRDGAGDNRAALAVAALRDDATAGPGGTSTIASAYEQVVNSLAADADAAKSDAESAEAIRQTLSAHRESLSGVSLDEEGLNLIRYQRAYQSAARVVATVDELLQEVLNLV